MARPPRFLLFLGFIASAGALPVLGEGVNASRYEWVMTEHLPPGESKVKTVELAPLEEMCRDDDGCRYTLNLSVGTLTGTFSEWLFLDVNEGHKWLSTPDTMTRSDGEFGATNAGSIFESGYASCVFSDGDAPDGLDHGPGFAMVITSLNFVSDLDVVCTLTVMD